MKVAVVGLAVPVRGTILRGRLIRNGASWSLAQGHGKVLN